MTTRPRTVHDDADLHPSTVTGYAAGTVSPVRPPAPRARGQWAAPVAGTQVPATLLDACLSAAGGDPNRLWFATDGSVYVLNHTRADACPSPACPACQDGRRTTHRTR